MLKVIVFDWGRTLYDSDHQDLFPGTEDILKSLSQRYKLGIVSLASNGNFAERFTILKNKHIEKHFDVVLFSQTDKSALYEKLLQQLNVKPEELAIIDDRVKRGISWGFQHGSITIWLCKGKYSYEFPDRHTGKPDYIIYDIKQLLSLPIFSSNSVDI